MLKQTVATFVPAINPEDTLEINYYNPYGEKVGTYSFNPLNIRNASLKELIDSNIPQNYRIVPYFAYPTSENITEEIMIAVKEIFPID